MSISTIVPFLYAPIHSAFWWMMGSFEFEAQTEPRPDRHRDFTTAPRLAPIPSDRQRLAIPPCMRPRSRLDGVPIEVTGMILQEIIEEAESNRDIYHLACVSRQLRQIALNLPGFWSKIIFSPQVNDEGHISHQSRSFNDAIWFLHSVPKRFRSNMIDVVIRDTSKEVFRYDDLEQIQRILRRFRRSRLGSWRSLSVHVFLEDTVYDFFRIFASISAKDAQSRVQPLQLPSNRDKWPSNLRSLELSCQSRSIMPHTPLPIFSAHALPTLRTLSLRGLDIDWSDLSHQIEPESLEQLFLEGVDVRRWGNTASFFQLLSDATLLHTLTMIDMDLLGAEADHNSGPILKSLRTLRLAWRTPLRLPPTMKCFALFDTPALKELVIAKLTAGERFQHNETRSDCMQQTLDQRRQCEDIEPLIEAISTWPRAEALTALYISGVRVDPDLSNSNPVDQFCAFLSAPSLRTVKSLFLRGTDKYLIESLFLGIDTGECMPSLRTVCLDEHAERACQEFLCANTCIRVDLQNVSLSLGSGKPIRFRGTPKT